MIRRITLFALAACNLASAAPLATETRATGEFHAVELTGVVDIEIRVGPARHVEVSADADVIAQITTEIRDGRLVVGTRGEFHPEHKTKVSITMPTLDAVALTGVGAITVTGVAAPSLSIDVSGTGSIELAGTAGTAAYHMSGTGSVHAKELAAKSAVVSLDGTGNIALRATEQVSVAVSGVGSVDVFGHPRMVTKSRSGLGHISVHD